MKDTIISVLDMYKEGQIGPEDAEKLIAALWDGGEEASLPWDNDNKLRVVAYRGRRLVKRGEAGDKLFELRLDGAPQGDIECWGSATIQGSVNGNVTAGVSVSVEGAVARQVNAGTSVTIEGDNYAPVSAGTDVTVNGDNYGPLNGGMNVTINGGDNCPPNGEPLRENNGFDFGSIGDFVNRTVRSAMQTAEGAVHWGMGKARKAAVRVEKSWKNDGFHMETPPVDGIEVVVRKN
ncbi:MAG: hypothetical protein MJ141_06130, partial [Clostridia bacterium]|nr:hypothetical protein [Clostridia bacterium]